MGAFVQQSLRRPTVRLLALQILNQYQVPNRSGGRSIQALYSWVKQNIRYVKDPVDVETVQDPEATIKIRAGDCDDQAVLMAALAMSIGAAARFVVIGQHRDAFEHVYPEINIYGRWIPADTVASGPFGQAPQAPVKKMYSITGEKIMFMSGAAAAYPIRVSDVKKLAYQAAYTKLKANWNNGLINTTDLKSYLRVIDEGNSPSRGTIVEAPMRLAISTFLAEVESIRAISGKPLGSINGMEGLNGFLKSVWGAVTSVVKGAINVVTGGGKQEIVVTTQPATATTAATPSVNVQPTGAGIMDWIQKNPLLVGAGVLGAILLLKK